MWLDALALLLLGAFVGVGALRGALASGLGLATLGVAYGLALWLGPRMAPQVASLLGTGEVLGMAAAGMGGFLLGFAGMGALARLARRREARRGRQARSPRDRFLGAAFGGLRGALVVLLLSWLALWVDALRATGTAPALPELGRSAAASLTGELVEAGVGAAMADAGPTGRVVARVAARPGDTLVEVQALIESPPFAELRSDVPFWTYVEHGSIDSAMNRASFQRVSRDDELRGRLSELGLVDERAAGDPRAFRAEVGEMLRGLGPRIRALKSDPELLELADDPEVQAMIQSGDTLALLGHPGFRRVVARALQGPEV